MMTTLKAFFKIINRGKKDLHSALPKTRPEGVDEKNSTRVSGTSDSTPNPDFPFAPQPGDDTPCTPTTTAMQDILECGAYLANEREIFESTVCNYYEIVGNTIGNLYCVYPRTKMQCNATTCVLAVHCGIESARRFLEVLSAESSFTSLDTPSFRAGRNARAAMGRFPL